MLNEIRQWFKSRRRLISANEFYKKHIQELEEELDSCVDVDSGELSIALCREILKLKDFSDLSDLDRNPYADTEQDRKNYCAVASTIFLSQPFKDIVKRIQYEQMKFAMLESQNTTEITMARGTINGAALIEERFEQLHAEHLKNTKPDQTPEGMDRYNSISQV